MVKLNGKKLRGFIQKYKEKRAYESAAESQIKKKAKAAYYRAKEKEAVKAAARRAAAEYKPKPKTSQPSFRSPFSSGLMDLGMGPTPKPKKRKRLKKEKLPFETFW